MPHKDPLARRVYQRHYQKARRARQPKQNLCGCGCGTFVRLRYALGHQPRPGVPKKYNDGQTSSQRYERRHRASRKLADMRRRPWRYTGKNSSGRSCSDTEYKRRWKRKWPFKVAEDRNRRRAQTRERVDYAAIWNAAAGMCYLCGQTIPNRKAAHFDHVIPISKGGHHVAGNIKPAHQRCNLSKGARLMPEIAAPSQIRIKPVTA